MLRVRIRVEKKIMIQSDNNKDNNMNLLFHD